MANLSAASGIQKHTLASAYFSSEARASVGRKTDDYDLRRRLAERQREAEEARRRRSSDDNNDLTNPLNPLSPFSPLNPFSPLHPFGS